MQVHIPQPNPDFLQLGFEFPEPVMQKSQQPQQPKEQDHAQEGL